MKRVLFIFFMFCFLNVSFAQAQMINYKRSKILGGNLKKDVSKSIRIQKKGVQEPHKAEIQAPQMEVSAKVEIRGLLVSNPKVASRIERIYDLNQDEMLQEDELRTFLKDVVAATEKKGTFSVSSELLQPFDNNEDMKIDVKESLRISQLLSLK